MTAGTRRYSHLLTPRDANTAQHLCRMTRALRVKTQAYYNDVVHGFHLVGTAPRLPLEAIPGLVGRRLSRYVLVSLNTSKWILATTRKPTRSVSPRVPGSVQPTRRACNGLRCGNFRPGAGARSYHRAGANGAEVLRPGGRQPDGLFRVGPRSRAGRL